MTEERLEQALGGGIGLSNVNERLRTIYGAHYQLKLQSVPGEGTCASVEIPELGAARARHGVSMDLRAVLVDDEQLARDELGYLLGQVGGVEVIGQAGNGVEALTTIDRLQPDVVFLDVQMPGLTGFEVARRMLDAQRAVAHHLRDRVRSARHRGVRGQRGRLPAEAGRSGAARAGGRARAAPDRPSTGRSSWPAGTAAPTSTSQLEKIVQLVAERQSRRERLAIKVGERFLLVQAEEIIYASLADESITVVTSQHVGDVELPDARRAAGAARPERLLARASIAPGEHQQDQGDRPLVQPELHPEDEGREGDGNPGEPHADAAAPGVPEAVDADADAAPSDADDRLARPTTTSSAATARRTTPSRRCAGRRRRRRRRRAPPTRPTPR